MKFPEIPDFRSPDFKQTSVVVEFCEKNFERFG